MNATAYHRDSYLVEMETEVVRSGEENGRPYAILADTIFYPEGGGQPADHGTVAGSRVIDVQTKNDEIFHFLAAPVDVGPASLVLDWPRRWDHMQQHTAQHLLTAVALRDFGWRTTAFHLGPEVSDIELDIPSLDRRDLERLETACAMEIHNARPVTSQSAEVEDFQRLGVRSRRLPEGFTGAVRLVSIDGLDLNTCGGTHVRSTSEIATLCLLGTESMRGGTKLVYAAGDRVRRRMARHEERNRVLRNLLDTGDDQLPEVVALRLEREKELARQARRLSLELAEATTARLTADPESTVDAHWEQRDMAFLQKIAHGLAEAAPQKCALLTSKSDDDFLFVTVFGRESGVDGEIVGPRIAEALGGRGGGRGPIFQGKAASLHNRNEALHLLRG